MSLLQNSNAISSGGYNLESSLRFRESASANLTRTPASAGNRKTWTWSGWVKLGNLKQDNYFFGCNVATNTTSSLYFGFNAGGGNGELSILSWGYFWRKTTQVFRDPSAWYHIVITVNTTLATANDRIKLYVNGEQVTSFSTINNPAQNADMGVNQAGDHIIGNYTTPGGAFFDGYMTEVNFVDGQALTPSDFGETDSTTGVWKPKEYAGTYGTNGFYLPMKETQQATGFNTVLWKGNGGTQSITGVGFSPDLVWIKTRNYPQRHVLTDTVRGATKYISTDGTTAEATNSNYLSAFNSDGFSIGTDSDVNYSLGTYVAWCWDAGSSTVSNTDGSITSSVRANPATGFSIATFNAAASGSFTVGHGLGTAPKVVITRYRNIASDWYTYHESIGNTKFLKLNDTAAAATNSGIWNNTSPNSDVFTLGSGIAGSSSWTMVAYCFSEVAGFSKFGSYTGTSASGNTQTLGFRPAFVMIRRTDSANSWVMLDSTRDPENYNDKILWANLSDVEASGGATTSINFLDTGFSFNGNGGSINLSGGTYIYMAFADTRDAQFNFDASGNKNNWTANNINSNASSETTYDIMNDVPTLTDENTANFATLNPLVVPELATTFSEGNLQFSGAGQVVGSMSMTFKSYYEYKMLNTTSQAFGVTPIGTTTRGVSGGGGNNSALYFSNSGNIFLNGSLAGTFASYTTTDVVSLTYDPSTGNVSFYKNNVFQATVTISSTAEVVPYGVHNTGASGTYNFGQRPFKYTPPTGYKKLNTYNLPDSTIVDGSQYFTPVTYTGNGGTQDITVGFKPEAFWVKNRTLAANHGWSNFVTDTYLYPNLTNSEGPNGSSINQLSDGFNLNTSSNVFNGSGASFVAWNWRGSDSSAVTNTNGTITSTVSANTTSGFSIVTYTGTAAVATVGHGLGVAPSMIITKNRDTTTDWWVYHSALGNTKYVVLNTTAVAVTSSTAWNNTSPTSTVFTLGGAGNPSNANQDVAYCFADVEGFSKFGSYINNASTDGPFVYTGFRPAFVMIKYITAGASDWMIFDSARDPYNVIPDYLRSNLSNAETTKAGGWIDFISNGFKVRNTDATTASINFTGGTGTFIYMAFAETPFKHSLAR